MQVEQLERRLTPFVTGLAVNARTPEHVEHALSVIEQAVSDFDRALDGAAAPPPMGLDHLYREAGLI